MVSTPSTVPSTAYTNTIINLPIIDGADLDASYVNESHIEAFDETLKYDLASPDEPGSPSMFASRSNSVANLPTTMNGTVSSAASVGSSVSGTNITAPPVLISSKSDWAPVYSKTSQGKRKPSQEKRKNATTHKYKDQQFLFPDDNSLTFKILRYPILFLILLWLFILAIVYLIIRISIYISEQIMTNTGKRRTLVQDLKSAKNYEEYIEKAKVLDEYLGLDKWCQEDRFYCYDWKTVRRIVRELKKLRRDGNYQELMIVLQNCVKSNFAGTENPLLYSHSYYGTKKLIEQYNYEVVQSLSLVIETTEVPIDTKRIFFKTVSRAFGKTALALSGGASFCHNHYGA